MTLGTRGNGGNGETVAFENELVRSSSSKTFMRGMGYSLCKSVCSPILLRPRHQEIVLGRLRGRIRRLFDVGASIRVEMRGGNEGNEERAIQFLWGGRPWEKISHHKITCLPSHNAVSYHYKINYIPQSLPVEGWIWSLASQTREPLANDLLMYWTAPNWCANGLAQIKSIPPFHKSFARLFQKPRSPRPRVPPQEWEMMRLYRKILLTNGAETCTI